MSDVLLVCADARRIPLPDESVQCVVTSPPYWGLRKYEGEQESVWEGLGRKRPGRRPPCAGGHDWIEKTQRVELRTGAGLEKLSERFRGGGHSGKELAEPFTVHRGTCRRCGAWRGAYGLEPTVEMYVAHTVEILREIRRVLRPDGVVFWNVGDSYCGSWGNYGAQNRGVGKQRRIVNGSQVPNPAWDGLEKYRPAASYKQQGLKPKDLVLMPERVALAAQADGWWVRSRIVWDKRNPMPESVTDRPTDACEHIWLFTKSERYFWDWFAVRESSAEPDRRRNDQFGGNKGTAVNHSPGGMSNGHSSRHCRNIWSFATQPYSGAHFATFPEELPRRAIIAGTSEKGACLQCGAPWRRVCSRTVHFESGSGKAGNPPAGKHGMDWEQAQSGDYDIRMGPVMEAKTIGWQPTCLCRGQHGKTRPCLVLEPFGGSGTTGRVAVELNRSAVLLDIAYGNSVYGQLAKGRTTNVQRNLLGT